MLDALAGRVRSAVLVLAPLERGAGLSYGVERTVQVAPPSAERLIVPSCKAT